MYGTITALMLVVLLVGGNEVLIKYKMPSDEIDKEYMQWALEHKKLSWRIIEGYANVSQAKRNEALAKLIESDPKDLKHLQKHLKKVAQAAELNVPIILEHEKAMPSVRKTNGKTPLARARAKKNHEVIKILQELGAHR